MKPGTLLIVDDEEKLRGLLARITALEGFEVHEAANARSALKKLEQFDVDVILCDVVLPDTNGVELSKQIKTRFPNTEIIMLTAYGNISDGVRSIKNGAFDYIMKGDDNNKIIPLVYKAIEKARLQKQILQLQKQVSQKFSFENIIGRSRAIMEAVSLAKKVAVTDSTVLLLGETGTGKEVFAQAIHNESPRRLKPFVAINCAAFSKDLLESEIFGHIAGAFTGALKDKKGLFEEANGGTVFLDEIGEMDISLQVKLLRVLESKEFIRVGDTKTMKIDVRVISATNRDLMKEVEKEQFREDLYYRLNGFQITLPPLRERVKDIELFAQHFAALFSAKINRHIVQLSGSFIEKLKAHYWKGNVRELKNVIERCVILSESDILTPEALPFEIQQEPSTGILSAFDLASAEKLHIQKVLNYTHGNKTETAKLLNIALTTLYRKLEEYKLN